MQAELDRYIPIVGGDVIDQLRQLARPLAGLKMVHVNSTRTGGGVAEILNRLVPLQRELGIDVSWEVLDGNAAFFDCTKRFHNGFQGNAVTLPPRLLRAFEETNAANAERLHDTLAEADVVIIHDPQPAPLITHVPDRKGKWFWRCHIDASRPFRPVWKYLRPFVAQYDASLWHLASFAQPIDHRQYLMPPSIDPLSEKNQDLSERQIDEVCRTHGIDRERPMIIQVSRFDVFKDPVGVIEAYRMVRRYLPHLQLVLAGGTADDDPEGAQVLAEVIEAANGDPNVIILNLPPDAHVQINALQRAADVVLQKSLKEGFGLTVTEALWKSKPVIGGDIGGIRLQVVNHHTGFLVNSPEGAALRVRYLLDNRDKLREMGDKGRRYVLENFLLTRHLREYLALILAVLKGSEERIELV